MEQQDGILCSFNEFLEHLKKHMEDVHTEVPLNDRLYSEEDYPKLKALLVESASLMERNISKLHLVFSGMTVQALISLLKDTETVFINVVESARLFICCGLSKAAKNEVVDGVDAIYTAIENLIDHCKVSYKEKRSKLSPSMTGAVWDACKRLSSISESNKKACMKESMRLVYIVRDIAKECKEHMENDSEDDWDGLLDDIQAFAGEGEIMDEIDEEDRSDEVKQAITMQVETIQHIFESLFKLYSSHLPTCIPIPTIPQLNIISDTEKALSEDANNFGMMMYTSESTDRDVCEKTKKDMNLLLETIPQVIPSCDALQSFTNLLQTGMVALDDLVSKL